MNNPQQNHKLNLGCGEFHKNGFINLDYYSVSEPDVRHNLNIIPYPFEPDYFDVIEADHVLEHLDNPFMIMTELYRISSNGARIIIRVPHFSRGFTHCDHKRGFDVTFPYYFNPKFPGGYQGIPLKIESLHLRWFAQPYLKKMVFPKILFYISSGIGWIIDFFANISPIICSRIWCYWVGGFEEIEFVFIVEK